MAGIYKKIRALLILISSVLLITSCQNREAVPRNNLAINLPPAYAVVPSPTPSPEAKAGIDVRIFAVRTMNALKESNQKLVNARNNYQNILDSYKDK